MEIGNLSEIISAITACGALSAAIVAALYAKKQAESGQEQILAVNKQIDQVQEQLIIEQKRDIDAKAQEAKNQASAIASWVETCESYGNRVIVENTSITPVRDVQVKVTTRTTSWNSETKKYDVHWHEGEVLKIHVVPPGKYVFVYNGPVKDRNEKSWEYGIPYSTLKTPSRPVLDSPKWSVESLAFTDATGRRWEQGPQGLNEI